jgi:hypothetical protein
LERLKHLPVAAELDDVVGQLFGRRRARERDGDGGLVIKRLDLDRPRLLGGERVEGALVDLREERGVVRPAHGDRLADPL